MVLVHPDCRRRGIGRGLLGHCIDRLREGGIRCIGLDATPAGREVYVGLGFKDEWTLQRWEVEALKLKPQPHHSPHARPWSAPDFACIESVDRAAFGCSRGRLLSALVRDGLSALMLDATPGDAAAFGLVRAGARAYYLGPVAARSDDAGVRVLRSLLATCAGQRVYWDIPDSNAAAIACAREHGFVPQRPLVRMFLGSPTRASALSTGVEPKSSEPNPGATPRRGNPRLQFALAGPEVG
jgi:predicted N-acetyltransferase YhbS